MSPSIVWLRQDLRLHDQPAFFAAAEEGAVVPVYILDDEAPGIWKIGGAQRWWLHHSLAALDERLQLIGSRLILRRGRSLPELARLARELGTRRVHATKHYEPWWQEAEQEVSNQLELVLHAGGVLIPPEHVKTGSGSSYKVYTPYWRALQDQLPPSPPLPPPDQLEAAGRWPGSDQLDAWRLLPTKPNWAADFSDEWRPGELTALERLSDFVARAQDYADRRNLPGEEGTSRFSPHLHFGELSPRQVWHSLPDEHGDKFEKELVWRDFAQNVMLTQPTIGERPAKAQFETFPGVPDQRRKMTFKLGARAKRAIRLSTLGCGNSGKRAGCAIGCE